MADASDLPAPPTLTHRLFLAIALAALFAFLLSMAAPYGGDAIYAAQSVMCHQRSDRSFHIDGAKCGLCARCTGVYAGLALTGLVYWTARRTRVYRVLGVASFAGPLTFGLEQMTGLGAHNPARFLVGLGLGLWLGFAVNWLFRN